MVKRKGVRWYPAHDFDVLTPEIWDDLLAVAVASSGGFFGKGDAHTEATRERIKRRRKRKPRVPKAFRDPAKNKRRIAELRGGSIEEFILAAMEPGEWYASPDLAEALPTIARKSIRAKIVQRLVPRGDLEKARNPDFEVIPTVLRFDKIASPEFLYRLTNAGIARRAAFLAKRGGSG